MTMMRSPLSRTGTLSSKRTRKCAVKGCATRFQPRNMGHKVCGPACAAVHAVKERQRLDAKQTRERKHAVKTRSDHIADTQAAFNALVRYRDRNETCISCPTVLSTLDGVPGGGYDCGHYRSRGSAPHLRFDFRNAHGQCKKCNRYRAGNAADYRIGLIARIGLAAVEALECDQAGGDWTIPGLLAMKAEFRAQLRAMRTEPAAATYSDGDGYTDTGTRAAIDL
jgi:hypothetical protein